MNQRLLPWTLAALVACGPRTVVVSSTPATSGTTVGPAPTEAARTGGWSIDAREHVDLWLHGLAMLQADSSLVPAYRLAYRREASEARRARGITSRLDDHATVLMRRLGVSPTLASAAFVPLYFASWDDLRRGCLRFLRDQGDVRYVRDRESVRMYATLATYFPGAAEREFLRLLLEALDDERQRFHRAWWQQQQAERAGRRQELATIWNGQYAVAFERFLRYSGQRTGTLLLTLSLGPEGRTLDAGGGDVFVAVPAPAPDGEARDALYVMAHEVVGTLSNQVVRDHTSPAQQQSGETARLETLAAVRAGALLLERVAPDLADGYRRYYLMSARQRPAAELGPQFDRIFPLPRPLLDALGRQVDLVLNGI